MKISHLVPRKFFLSIVALVFLLSCGSQDSKNLFALNTKRPNVENWDVAIFDNGEGTIKYLTENSAFDWGPTWSPDHKKILFSTEYLKGEIEEKMVTDPDTGLMVSRIQEVTSDRDIALLDLESKEITRLTEGNLTDDYPAWSPDGKKIVFMSERSGWFQIHVMDADGKNVKKLTEEDGEKWKPAWSPDGKKIAFAGDGSDDWEIYIMNQDGSDLQQVTEVNGHDWGPAWSPDGQKIAFASNRSGDFEIYVMDTNGENVKQLTNTPGVDFEPVWSPDGKKIDFASQQSGETYVSIMTADGEMIEPKFLLGIPSDWILSD